MFSAFTSRNGDGRLPPFKMFSEEDLRNMFEVLPPQKPEQPEELPILPPLLLSSRGEGFVTEQSVSRNFKNLVQTESERLPLTTVSNKLDVDHDTSLRLLRASPHLALLSADESTVITTNERNSIVEHLRNSLRRNVVSKNSFSSLTNVSRASINALVHSEHVSTHVGEDIREVDDHLFTAGYEQAVSDKIKEKIDRSLQEAEPVELTSTSITETAPLWFIQRAANSVIHTQHLSEHFLVDQDSTSTRYVPIESIIRRRDAVVSQLESGELTHIDIRSFMGEFKDIFQTFDDANEYLIELDFIFILGVFAISRSWITSLAEKYIDILDAQDFVDCSADLPSSLPRAIYDSILGMITHRVISWDSSSPEDFCQTGSFVLTLLHHDRECAILYNYANTDANSQWQAHKATPDKDIKFQLAEILAKVPKDRKILGTVAQDHDVQTAVADHFWGVISDLELQNEADFSAFWIKRVLSRQQNYCEALKAIEDTKLHDQLAELLAAYLQKDLVSDTISKARSQGLVCSRKTNKSLQKLETALKANKKDLAGVLSSIEKFGKKQDIAEVDTAALEEAKNVMVGDMLRRMQKPKTDGPLLFLTLIVVLFAKHYPGVIYATGKFTPKLLKLLKPKLNADDYEKLEAWKESAKAGTLGSDEQKAMGQMVDES